MKTKRAQKETWPQSVTVGNVTVKIYRGTNKAHGKGYDQYTLVYYDANGRVKRRFADPVEAEKEAKKVAGRLDAGENKALELTSLDAASYLQAMEQLKPLNIPLHVAASEYASAVTRLPKGIHLREAVDFFLQRNPNMPSKTVREVVDELLAAKAQAGRSELHQNDLESRLGRFAESFEMPIRSVNGSMIQQYLLALTTGPKGNEQRVTGRTQRNHLRHITSLLRFAIRRKYLDKDAIEEVAAVEKPDVKPTETLIFTPDELRELLHAARPEILPWLAVAAFCGLRTAEVRRLDWAQVNVERQFVEVKAMNAKTAARRLVPICEAGVAWLTPHRKPEGHLAYYTEENKFYSALLADVNDARRAAGNEKPFLWKHNALRHSFCSYRLALTNDAAKTAMEAGNTPAMIFRHYRELVTHADAMNWFGLMP